MKTGIWLLCLGLSEKKKKYYNKKRYVYEKNPILFFQKILEMFNFLDYSKTIIFHFLMTYITYT